MRNQVYRLRSSKALVLDVQSSLLDHLKTRVVVPLEHDVDQRIDNRRFLPVFELHGVSYTMMTHKIAAIPEAELGEAIGSLETHHTEITAALDFLFQGF